MSRLASFALWMLVFGALWLVIVMTVAGMWTWIQRERTWREIRRTWRSR